MPSTECIVRYIKRNFDEAAILAVATKVAFSQRPTFSESELATISAMQRAHPSAGDSTEELGQWLANMDEGQIAGVVSNTKGVLHEMEFVRIENQDGDSIHASLFESTNHPGFDVQLVDFETDRQWAVQLKATDTESYVQDWIEEHPDGEILITKELADEMGLPSSGSSNEVLTAKTESVVDRLVNATDEDSMWDYFPEIAVVSAALVAWEIFQRYRRGEIGQKKFKWLVFKTTGLKAAKISLLCLALSIPGINIVAGASLVASLIVSSASTIKKF